MKYEAEIRKTTPHPLEAMHRVVGASEELARRIHGEAREGANPEQET